MAQINSANDSAFYCMSGLRAVGGEEKFKLLLQICLDAEALRLAKLCVRNPEWTGRTNYTLLKRVDGYLNEHKKEREGIATLRPVEEVRAKLSQAIGALEMHEIDDK